MGLRIGGIITALFLLLALGCSGSSSDQVNQAGAIEKPMPVARAASGMSPAVSHCDVMVDDMLMAGNCDIYNDGNLMHFVFTANEMWAFSRVRVYCDTVVPEGDIEYRSNHELGTLTTAPFVPGPALSDEPVDIGAAISNNTVMAGQLTRPLPYEMQLDSPASSLHLVFNVSGWSVGEPLYIKADVTAQGRTAVVYSGDAPGEEVFEYYPRPELSLPGQQILTYLGHGEDSTYETTLYNCPDGFDVKGMTPYTGWCVDLWHVIYPNQMYNVKLYNSYDPNLPERLQDEDWDMANYVVNHKQGNANAVQGAIWYFVGGGDYPSGGNAKAMVDDALANGEGYTPPAAGTVIVIVDVAEDTQTTAIEVVLEDFSQH